MIKDSEWPFVNKRPLHKRGGHIKTRGLCVCSIITISNLCKVNYKCN